jgi:hypothetical protein
MDINTILVIGISTLFGYLIYKSLKPTKVFNPQRFGLLVAQDTGKTKHVQSKTGDASLAIERIRRTAIQNGGRDKIKETRTQKGSTTGALEVFFISRICACVCPPTQDIIYDGGGATNEYCPIHGFDNYDAGGADTRVCGI